MGQTHWGNLPFRPATSQYSRTPYVQLYANVTFITRTGIWDINGHLGVLCIKGEGSLGFRTAHEFEPQLGHLLAI